MHASELKKLVFDNTRRFSIFLSTAGNGGESWFCTYIILDVPLFRWLIRFFFVSCLFAPFLYSGELFLLYTRRVAARFYPPLLFTNRRLIITVRLLGRVSCAPVFSVERTSVYRLSRENTIFGFGYYYFFFFTDGEKNGGSGFWSDDERTNGIRFPRENRRIRFILVN